MHTDPCEFVAGIIRAFVEFPHEVRVRSEDDDLAINNLSLTHSKAMSKTKPAHERIRIGQVYVHKRNKMELEVVGKAGAKWKTRVLTIKSGVYNGTHTMAESVIRWHFILIPKQQWKSEGQEKEMS